eukprot:8355679-Pyramimonas_sp.AAC.1
MVKVDCPFLRELILGTFNARLDPSQRLPSDWMESRVAVLFRKGDASLPSNYRPVAILAILCKLFSKLLCGRLRGPISEGQSVDQAAYRKGFSTIDHLLTFTLLAEASNADNAELWMGLVDFEKGFDAVEHDALWKALREQRVPDGYIDLFKRLCAKQGARVSAGGKSRLFDISRGVKQGDPISSFLLL